MHKPPEISYQTHPNLKLKIHGLLRMNVLSDGIEIEMTMSEAIELVELMEDIPTSREYEEDEEE